ncbi:MAG: hypothetical protein IJJ22_00230, partial [Oscillospiraceae bacterium]|nr:hypothetical protein [Oscillospiraceae bacterium]
KKYEKSQQKLSWTQDAWKSVNTSVHDLYSKVSSLRFSSAYSMKKRLCHSFTGKVHVGLGLHYHNGLAVDGAGAGKRLEAQLINGHAEFFR